MSARRIDPPTYLDAVVTASFKGVSSGTLSLPINFVSEMIYCCYYSATSGDSFSATDSEGSLYLSRIKNSFSGTFISLVAAHNSMVPTTNITLKTNSISGWIGWAAGIVPAIGLNPYSNQDNVATSTNSGTISTTTSDLILAFFWNQFSDIVAQVNYPPFNFLSLTHGGYQYLNIDIITPAFIELATEYTQMEPGLYTVQVSGQISSFLGIIDTIKIHKPYVDVASPLIVTTSTPSSVNIGNMITYNSSTTLTLWSLTNDQTATGFLNGEKISSISTSGAVWTNRLFTKFSGIGDVGTTVNFGEIEEWYAPTSGSISNSITIVATSSDSGLREIYAFAAVGLNNISSPFDSAALPVSNFIQLVSSVSIGVNRNQNQDLVYGLVAVVESSSFKPAPNQISFTLTTLSQFSVNVFYTPISAASGTTGISASGLANNNPSGTIQWLLVGDALTAVPAGHTPVNASALLSSSLLWATIYNRQETRPLFSQPLLTTYSVRTPQRLIISTLNTATDKLRSSSRSLVSSLSILSNPIRSPLRQLLSTLMILTVLSSVRLKAQTLITNLGIGTQALRSVQRQMVSSISLLTNSLRQINRTLITKLIISSIFQSSQALRKQLISSIQTVSGVLRGIGRPLITMLVVSSFVQLIKAKALQLTSTIQFASNAIRGLSRAIQSSINLLTSMLSSVISAGGKVIILTANLVFSASRLSSLIRSLSSQITMLSSFMRRISRSLLSLMQIGTFVQRALSSMRQISSGIILITSTIRSPSRLFVSIIALQSAVFRILNRLLLIGISVKSNVIRTLTKILLITMIISLNVAIQLQQIFKFVKIKFKSLINLIKVNVTVLS